MLSSYDYQEASNDYEFTNPSEAAELMKAEKSGKYIVMIRLKLTGDYTPKVIGQEIDSNYMYRLKQKLPEMVRIENLNDMVLTTKAIFYSGHPHKLAEFEIARVGLCKYNITCTYGAWSCLVDELGQAIGDSHFKKGKQMITHLIKGDTNV